MLLSLFFGEDLLITHICYWDSSFYLTGQREYSRKTNKQQNKIKFQKIKTKKEFSKTKKEKIKTKIQRAEIKTYFLKT